jgi:hypothetical protein
MLFESALEGKDIPDPTPSSPHHKAIRLRGSISTTKKQNKRVSNIINDSPNPKGVNSKRSSMNAFSLPPGLITGEILPTISTPSSKSSRRSTLQLKQILPNN